MTISDLRNDPPAPSTGPRAGSRYLLGSERPERDRLDLQAAYYRAATSNAMRCAGIGPGMRVLDIGSGTGAVAFVAAEQVGPTGSVLGLDASPDAVAAANAEARRRNLANVSFARADLDHWSAVPDPTGSFDALTGRLIAMYLPDRARTIARLSSHLRPGGIVLLEEFSMTSCRQQPRTEIERRTMDLILAAFRVAGIPTDLGLDLGDVFRAAGLGTPEMVVGGRLEDGADAIGYALMAQVVATLAPVMIKFGLVTAEELQLDTLETRLRTAAAAVDARILPPLLISAWARTPD